VEESIVKKRFVKQLLENEGQRLMKYQGLAMRRYLSFHTGETERERDVTVSGGDDMDGKLSFTARSHVRFLDIKRKGNRIQAGRIKGNKVRRIFNRVIMQQYNGIAMRLMYDYTDEVAASIRKNFEKQ
jgi:hypothetical protein